MNTSSNITSDDPSNASSRRRSTTADAVARASADVDPSNGDQGEGDRKALRDPRTGPAVALVTAAFVFGLGQALMPGPEPPPPPIAASIVSAAPVALAAPVAAVEPARAGQAAVAPGPAAATPSVQAARNNLADKDIAREAWRKNAPDISEDERRASLLIPTRGSTDGATYKLIEKSRGVVLNLPKGESMITMPFYRLKNGAFTTLWIKQDQGQPTEIRLMLARSVIKPEVEIKDGFVRVTVTKTVP
ncbi:MAG TPA: hypothetical protein VFH73_18515 [Polyangia bacterium]|jgi:hypothetical protein|nr:hypothetical protein [Polyangia bacterium]